MSGALLDLVLRIAPGKEKSDTVRFEAVQIDARLPAGSFDLVLPKDVVEVK